MGTRLLLLGIVATVLASGCAGPGAQRSLPIDTALVSDPVCGGTFRAVALQGATMADLQRALDAGEVTSVELVDAFTARFLAFDEAGPKLNSIQVLNPKAREIAAALDAERAQGKVRGPLHGLPILLKDNVGTTDMPTTAGSIALAKNVPPLDATITQRLRDAGAIIFGKAQLSEFANWMSPSMPSGYSSLGGQVRNAYTGGNPSGSSSGSGVAASMAFAAGTIGTETSGSILSPSNANSVVGLKPTMGLLSRAGIIPLAENFDVPGPMVRNVADAAAMVSAMVGPDPRDPETAASQGKLPPNNDYVAGLSVDALKGVRLGYLANNANSANFVRARADLQALGAVLVPIEQNQLTSVSILEIPLIFNEFKFGVNQYLAKEAGPGLPVKDLTDIILYNHEHPNEVRYGQHYLIASDATPGVGPLADAAALPVVALSRVAADKLFADNNVQAIVGAGAPFTSLGAAAGYPTITLPSGYDGRSPQGLSFFGPAFSEPKLLAYAYAYEQATHRREPPTTINPSLLEGVCQKLDAGAAPTAFPDEARADASTPAPLPPGL